MLSNISFKEAIALAESRKVVLPDEYYGNDYNKARATTLSNVAALSQIKFVVAQYKKAIKNGLSLEQFKESVRKGDIKIELPDYRLDTFFRTNIQTAYNFGRFTNQQTNAALRPFLMYDAVNDTRTRPTHAELDNTILPIGDKFWQTHYPPLGFNCRCIVISLTPSQAAARGITQQAPQLEADVGFGKNIEMFESNINDLFTSAIDQAEFDFLNISRSLSSLSTSTARVRNTEAYKRALLAQNPAEGTVKAQYVRFLNVLTTKSKEITPAHVRLLNDYTEFGSPQIVALLKDTPLEPAKIAVSSWIAEGFRTMQAAAPNAQNQIFTSFSLEAKKNVLQIFKQGAIIRVLAPLTFTTDQEIAKTYLAQGYGAVNVFLANSAGVGIDVVGAGGTSLKFKKVKPVVIVPGTKFKVIEVVNTPSGDTNLFLEVTNEPETGAF